MRTLIAIFLFLLVAVWLGFLIHQDSGYVLIAYQHTTIETSLWIAIIALLITFSLLYIVLRLLVQTTLLGNRLSSWEKRRKDKKSRALTNVGLCELAEGYWQQAEQTLIKAAKNSKSPLINYLAAARAAQATSAFDKRDEYLRLASQMVPDSEIAVGLTQATLQMSSDQWEQALATLQHLHQLKPQHRYILYLLKKVYLEVKDWPQLQKLLSTLKRNRIIDDQEYEALELKIFCALINGAAESTEPNDLIKCWDSIPRKWQHQTHVVLCYCQRLIERANTGSAAALIEQAIKKHWDERLIHLYGDAITTNPAEQLTTAEKWLGHHPHDHALLLCLGKLSLAAKLYGKAEQYLKDCMTLNATQEAYKALAQVYEALGDKERALACYKKA